jgi:two-component system, chemotaxis family, protein-glutamate methylesterase/glutaminase
MKTVLVVDDSALMRRLISSVLQDAGYKVETARNGVEGVQRLMEIQPDVVTLDLNMPEMDGLTALSLMMQARPTPVVLVSSLTTKGATATLEGLALGAVDFLAKPGGTISLSIDDIAAELLRKVKAAASCRMRAPKAMPNGGEAPPPTPVAKPSAPQASATQKQTSPSAAPTRVGEVPGVVLIGVSTGGPRTLEDILPQLPADLAWPVVVAQHMPANFTGAFAERMDRMCALRVQEVTETMPLERGHVYIGQGGSDLVLLERFGRLAVQPRPESPQLIWHPSVDLLVDSARKVMPAKQLIGVELTGMGNDGARAMAELKQAGGRTIAESQESAVVFGMPAELIARGGASLVLPSTGIARQIIHWTAS